MKSLPAFLLIATLTIAAVPSPAAETPSATLPTHAIPRSQLRVLPRNAAGRQYQLHIGLPESYFTSPDRHYPVVFVTDAYWDFAKIFAIEGALVYDKVVPEFITVGLGYAGENLDYGSLRLWELSPTPFPNNPASGHAADFLQTLATEIIPFVEREYRADPSCRVLAGASLGGLFTLYTMYAQPELFHAYIAATPAVVVGNGWLFGHEEKFAQSGRPLRARLFMAGGGNESPDFLAGILRFNALVSARKYAGLVHDFRVIDGERHAGMQFETYVRGLRFAFASIAPETGPAAD
jgi:predicted alpha/beta superfamily hydrolase